jgi:hypothetical protein
MLLTYLSTDATRFPTRTQRDVGEQLRAKLETIENAHYGVKALTLSSERRIRVDWLLCAKLNRHYEL